MIYVGDHKTLLHNKYISCGPHGFREEDFIRFPIVSLWKLLIPEADQFEPQGLDWQNTCRGPLQDIALYQIYKLWASWFQKRGFLKLFSHYKSMGAICCHGNQNSYLISPKTLCSLSPNLMILYMKFDQNWPTDLRDILLWKCGRTTPDHHCHVIPHMSLRLRWANK